MSYKIEKISGFNFIKITHNNFEVTFSDLGASIYSIFLDKKSMLLTPKNIADFASPKLYHGKTVGRTGNRIPGNEIVIDNKKYYLENNEGKNTLHGGTNGLSTKIFAFKVDEYKLFTKVTFNYLSKDNEGGYPGNLNTKITYYVSKNKPSIKIVFDALVDKTTMCNLTNHSYFTLGEASLADLKLKISASKYLKTYQSDLLPIKKDKVFSELDFRKPKPILKDISCPLFHGGKLEGYDHHFYFDNPKKHNNIVLKGSKYALTIDTDFDGVQIYTDNFEDDIEFIQINVNVNRGIAIEPQDDYLNRKFLEKNVQYKRYIKYIFKYRNK